MTTYPDPANPPTRYRYGDAWERYPVRAGERWGVPANGSALAVHNLFDGVPNFMCQADLLFCDPPWNLGNVNAFYTKAGRDDYLTSFTPFEDALFTAIAVIRPHTCYLEIGRQHADAWLRRLSGQYPHTQRWDVTYYRKHPCVILRGGERGPLSHDYTGWDEAKVIADVGRREAYAVLGDLCMGQGLVGLAAYDAGRPFVGTDINARRLAVLLAKLAKRGAPVARYEDQ